MRKLFILILLLTEVGLTKPLEKTSTTKKYAEKLKMFLGKPIRKFSSSPEPAATKFWGKDYLGFHYKFKTGTCDFIFYFEPKDFTETLVTDVSVSSEACLNGGTL